MTRGTAAGWKRKTRPVQVGIDCKAFYIPRCTNQGCRAPLSDSKGNPRWDILEGRFVCLGGCTALTPAPLRRKNGGC